MTAAAAEADMESIQEIGETLLNVQPIVSKTLLRTWQSPNHGNPNRCRNSCDSGDIARNGRKDWTCPRSTGKSADFPAYNQVNQPNEFFMVPKNCGALPICTICQWNGKLRLSLVFRLLLLMHWNKLFIEQTTCRTLPGVLAILEIFNVRVGQSFEEYEVKEMS